MNEYAKGSKSGFLENSLLKFSNLFTLQESLLVFESAFLSDNLSHAGDLCRCPEILADARILFQVNRLQFSERCEGATVELLDLVADCVIKNSHVMNNQNQSKLLTQKNSLDCGNELEGVVMDRLNLIILDEQNLQFAEASEGILGNFFDRALISVQSNEVRILFSKIYRQMLEILIFACVESLDRLVMI